MFKLNLDGAEWKIRQALKRNEGYIKTIFGVSVDNIIQSAKLNGEWNCSEFSVKYSKPYGVDHFAIWE